MSSFVVGLVVVAGLALVVVGILLRAHERQSRLAEILDLPFGERDVPADVIEQRGAFVDQTVDLANRVIEQFDAKGALAKSLERARIPIRPAEFVVVVGSFAMGAAAVLYLLSRTWWLALIALVLSPVVARLFVIQKVSSRRKAFERQFPDALSLIAGSLSAGHTFLRAIQMMTEEAEAPISEEFARVVHETRLGDPLVDSLERMAARLDIRDMEWVVQAIRVQQTVGGKLADLLHTLADFIRAREEVRLEVAALTAEGRISAYVLGAMPAVLLAVFSVTDKAYMAPMYRGWGPVVLAATGVSVAIGVVTILRMVRIEV
ncbi:MAG: type II secretion system F family protein [Acidimicrobiales bacterium]